MLGEERASLSRGCVCISHQATPGSILGIGTLDFQSSVPRQEHKTLLRHGSALEPKNLQSNCFKIIE